MTTIALPPSLDFELPGALIAGEPPEARGRSRDDVRLMVTRLGADDIAHTRLSDLPAFLSPGDLVVVNTSATINAALGAWRNAGGGRGEPVALHLSSPRPDGRWAVEVRRVTPTGTAPFADVRPGDRLSLPASAGATIVEPYIVPVEGALPDERVRLWIAQLDIPGVGGVLPYLARFGSPIRYAYVRDRWPLDAYQTMFADEPGSAEMPSAGRAFTPALVERLRQIGVRIARVLLHTGVASLERDEPPYPERFRVPPAAAVAVNRARADHRRVVAVGTTVVRALETVAQPDGRVRAAAGWTDLVITPDRGLRTVGAILTGLHEPRSSHLAMLETLAGRRHLARAYEAALERRYRWHEFGDLHLIVGAR